MGIAGRIAQGFLRSKLTPLVTVASLLVGVVVGLIGMALLGYGRGKTPSIVPRRSAAEAQKTATMAKEKMQ